MKLKCIRTANEFEVNSLTKDKIYPCLGVYDTSFVLIWDDDEKWYWYPVNLFEPVDKE